mmetsp:Transcript_19132/g.42310  ORF Transcript_19132/g.42310 Transcript_19132/m.42310 type:complete len:216 (+) Transcript_19132:139-786(+)
MSRIPPRIAFRPNQLVGPSEILINRERVGLLSTSHHTGFLILTHPLLEEVRLALQRNKLHPVEWVAPVVNLGMAQSDEQPISHELDISCHHRLVHPNQIAWQRFADEFPLHIHSTPNDFMNNILGQLVLEHRVQQTGEVRMETLVSGNQLIRERQSRHQTPFLEPIDGAERPTEQDAFHTSEADQSLSETVGVVHPLHRPSRFRLHCRDLLDCVE